RFENRGIARRPRRRVASENFLLHDDSPERQQSVHARRSEARFGRDLPGKSDSLRQSGRINPEPAQTVLRFERQRRLDIAAAEPLARQNARRRFNSFETRWNAKPQIEAAAIDAANFPAPAQHIESALRVGKSRHADKRHSYLLHEPAE